MRRFYQIDASHLILGTTQGSAKDAKLFAEAQAEKYCDIPKKAAFRLKKVNASTYHFEIQERSVTGSILDKILSDLKEDPDSEIYINDASDRQYQIYQRRDGGLRTFVRASGDNVFPDGGEKTEVLQGAKSKLKPFFDVLELTTWSMGVMFALSLVAAVAAGSISLSTGMVEDGYRDAIHYNPVSALASGGFDKRYYTTEKLQNLPAVGGLNAIRLHQARSSGVIGKLEYKSGRWTTTEKQ